MGVASGHVIMDRNAVEYNSCQLVVSFATWVILSLVSKKEVQMIMKTARTKEC